MLIMHKTKTKLHCYHDGVFFVFDRQALIMSAAEVGHSWAGGKPEEPLRAIPGPVISGSVYHNILLSTLIENDSN